MDIQKHVLLMFDELQDKSNFSQLIYEMLMDPQWNQKQQIQIIKIAREINELYSEQINSRNVRKAGRKSRYSNEDKSDMYYLHVEGKSLEEIAVKYGCSAVYVRKIVNTF